MVYEVVGGIDIPDMVKKVNKLLRKGWKLQGGISHSGKDGLYYQAMTSEKSRKKNEK